MSDLFSFDIGLNLDRKPLVNFNFVLRVEALYDLPCKSIKSFNRANEFEYVQEGGLNDYVHMLRKPISQPFTFQVERYVGVNLLDPLTLGTDLVLPVILMVNRTYGSDQTVRYYLFTGCTVISKDFGGLDSERSALLVETTTIAYREMFCIDNPFAGITADAWSFDGTSKEGSGTRSARKSGAAEPGKSDMQALAKKWMFADGGSARSVLTEEELSSQDAGQAFKGINGSAAGHATEARKAEMEGAARKWPPTKSAASVASYLSATTKTV
ncbi:MAG: hypothetical protein LIO86_02700 [Lachnospiraceae bacterium]|nr:hypothetical protein [Lachnospiraceae bacterium]